MALEGEYLQMPVYIDDLDRENLEFFAHCGNHELRLQQCDACGLKRFPPTTACPFCAAPASGFRARIGPASLTGWNPTLLRKTSTTPGTNWRAIGSTP